MNKSMMYLAVLASVWASVAQALVIDYATTLSPSVAGSSGSGTVALQYDTILHTLALDVDFQNLTGTTTAAHIHCCVASPGNAGVATTTPSFLGFPLGVTAGSYNAVLDLTLASSYNPAFVTGNGGTLAGAEAALLAGFNTGQGYFNVHTNFAPGGEIRGYLTQSVPEPAGLALLGLGLAGLLAARRPRRR